MITINNLEEIKPYYDKESNTYIFNDDVCFYFNLNIDKNIDAYDIDAWNINANDINAYDIDAWNINANDINACDINACDINAKDINADDIKATDIIANNINANDINACDINADDIKATDIIAHKIDANNINFYAICCAYETLKCKSIKGRRENSKIICLDNDIELKEK